MNYSDTRFTLDAQLHQAQVSVSATLNDTARRLCIGFTDGRKPYTIADGCTAAFAAKKPDGLAIFNSCTIENNTIIYEFTPQTTNVIGTYECEIRLYNEDGLQLTSPRFLLVVDAQAVDDDDIIDSFTEVTALNQIITNEAERIVKENERLSNEATRQSNETNRDTAEKMRKASEDARNSSEYDRYYAETVRQANEEARNEQESRRLNSEASRYGYEAERQAKEDKRIADENTRNTNESKRIEDETKRNEAETERVDAEKLRVSAEEEREALMGDLGTTLDAILDLQDKQMGDDFILATAYPIGSIYMSVLDTDPASLFGGSWVRLEDRFLLGAGSYSTTNGNEGGAATHTLTEAELPNHRHYIRYSSDGSSNNWALGYLYMSEGADGNHSSHTDGTPKRVYSDTAGGDAAHNNMPPYLAVYMWKREA